MIRTIFAAAALTVAAAAPAAAARIVFLANLDAAQEVPTNDSTATGTARYVFDTRASTLSVALDVAGLTTGLRDGHIHASAPVGVNAPVVVGFPALPLGLTTFTYTNTLDLLNTATYRAAFLAANGGTAAGARDALLGVFSAGLAYTNIHTERFPGGEIRGQIAVPTPPALALLGLGVAGIALRRRR